MHVVFWQNMPSIHQSALIRTMALQPQYDVTLVTENRLPTEMIEGKGWSRPDFGPARLLLAPDIGVVDHVLASADKEAVHIFSASRSYPLLWSAFLRCRSTEALVGLQSESFDWRGASGMVRIMLGRLDALRFQRRIDFVLAIGSLSQKWYRMVGYPRCKIYPFAYFTEMSTAQLPPYQSYRHVRATFNIVFVGQCIKRKGFDILLNALSRLSDLDWSLCVVGEGPLRHHWEDLTRKLGISERVHFMGALPNKAARSIVARSDLLVLPSRWDGWGAVINESIMAGTPAVCTNYCGGRDLIRAGVRGAVVRSNDVKELASAIGRQLELGPIQKETREHIQTWSSCITGHSAARYLRTIVEHIHGRATRPVAPWLDITGLDLSKQG
jgi:glycosyltransferase involved in cell wall biosynthesis